ncbi:Reticulocyte-binding protein 2-like protein a [Frankliniella fusca]|uniref:Reticulocyte-binding protein 2-like protein a n=1 Tax=Frankliniella fusca TaxID=407009 RepID=A0AAE1L996_9NEOP|nr:Reticulocyte-binding protein 2-like protein a [Frankliniella fusca]
MSQNSAPFCPQQVDALRALNAAMFALRVADGDGGGGSEGRSGRAHPVPTWVHVAHEVGAAESHAQTQTKFFASLMANFECTRAQDQDPDDDHDEEYTSSSEDVTHTGTGSQDDRGTAVSDGDDEGTEEEDDDDDEEHADSDHFEDADNDLASPRPSVAPRYQFQHLSPTVKCAAVPLVHPDQRVSKRCPPVKAEAGAGVRRAVVARIGAGDVGGTDDEDDYDEDSDDEALPEDIEVPREPRDPRHLGRSQSTHARPEHPGQGALPGSRSVSDLRHREATFTVRSPRTRCQDGAGTAQRDRDDQPLSVGRVRTALLHLKSFIAPQADGQGDEAAAPGARPADHRQARVEEHEQWFRLKRQQEERRRREAQLVREEQERREREEQERLLQKEIDQDINFSSWRQYRASARGCRTDSLDAQKKSEMLIRARREEEERRRQEEREREESAKREEARRERASAAYRKWLEEKKRALKEKLMREEEARLKRERSAERRREQAEEAFQKWREKQRPCSQEIVFLNPEPWVDIVPPPPEGATTPRRKKSRKNRSRSRCRRCRSQKILQSAERLSRPATCPRADATGTTGRCTHAPKRPASERRLRFADPPERSRNRPVIQNVTSMFCRVDKQRDALYEMFRINT